jgi:hypothetical protein
MLKGTGNGKSQFSVTLPRRAAPLPADNLKNKEPQVTETSGYRNFVQIACNQVGFESEQTRGIEKSQPKSSGTLGHSD